jgi:hypothetical protein
VRTRLALIGACVLVALTGGVTYVGVARDRVGADLERRNEEAEAFLDDWEPGDPAPAADTGAASASCSTFTATGPTRRPTA